MTKTMGRYVLLSWMLGTLLFYSCNESKQETPIETPENTAPLQQAAPPIYIPQEPTPPPEPPPPPKPGKSELESYIAQFLSKNFDTHMRIFTFKGNVELSDAEELEDGEFELQGDFDYSNVLDITMRRKFVAVITPFLDEYNVQSFKFYLPNLDGEWYWEEIK